MLDDIVDKALSSDISKAERAGLNSALRPGIEALENGTLRAVRYNQDGSYSVDERVKRIILAYFKTGTNEPVNPDRLSDGYDRIRLRFSNGDRDYLDANGIRIVPGAIVREGAYLGRNTVLMPCFVNIGAYIGDETMIDTWATVGSCAQIGKRVHISGGAGIGGVLEPIGAQPVIIEDSVFIGARSEVAEGVIIRSGAVLSMGVYIGRSTPVIDAATGEKWTGVVPANAVVLPGSYDPDGNGIATYAAIIKKYADEGTRSKLKLDSTFRGQSHPVDDRTE